MTVYKFLKNFFLISLITTSVYAEGPFYNCESDANNFFVSIKKDADGEWCVWRVKTGVTTPVGGYQPKIVYFDPSKFKVAHPSIANCSPTAFHASYMELSDGMTLVCRYIPVGAMDRPQEVDFSNFTPPFTLQQFKNNQWVSVEGPCDSKSQNCRAAPAN